jgi:hypothetical protein
VDATPKIDVEYISDLSRRARNAKIEAEKEGFAKTIESLNRDITEAASKGKFYYESPYLPYEPETFCLIEKYYEDNNFHARTTISHDTMMGCDIFGTICVSWLLPKLKD